MSRKGCAALHGMKRNLKRKLLYRPFESAKVTYAKNLRALVTSQKLASHDFLENKNSYLNKKVCYTSSI